ncbi:hypothetical protein TNCV_4852791 [Trichonephila clavipes]|nr:hypothetical protein TNCV_4852791 [Trichonephila clavipes]
MRILNYGWTVALQWVPSHIRIPGNKRADKKAKQEAELLQPEVSLTLRKAQSLINTYTDKCIFMTQETKSLANLCDTLATVGPKVPGKGRCHCPLSLNHST